jgi:hypothetical protein
MYNYIVTDMKKILALLLFVALSVSAYAEEKTAAKKTLDTDFKFSVLSYLHYSAEYQNDEFGANEFNVSRAYFTVKKKYNSFLSFRMTIDAYNGDDGIENRLKYLYAKFKLPSFFIFHKSNIEFGLVHTPWLDFEEHINYYRMQGKMYVETYKTFNSADLGGTFTTLLGGEIDKDYQKRVSKKYPGRYGSLQFGVYNGGGYHDLEINEKNKVFQARLTARPLPDIIPGFQLSGLIVRGQGELNEDTNVSPMYEVNMLMASYEHELFALTATYLDGRGNNVGSKIDSNGHAQTYDGYSFFGEYKGFGDWKIFGRYDTFNNDMSRLAPDAKDYAGIRIIGGIGYDFGNRNILLIDLDNFVPTHEDEAHPINTVIKLTMQVHMD